MDSSSEGPLGPSLFMGPDAFRFRFNPSEVNCYSLRNLLICLQLTVMRDIAMALLKTQPISDCVLSQFLTIGFNTGVREPLGFVAFAFARERGRKAESA